LAPAYANPTAEQLACYNTIIAALRCQVNAGIIGCCSVFAYVYLLAHLLTLQGNANLGVVSSMTEGNLSISFAVSSDSEFLNSTPWGRAYEDLIKRTVFAPFVTNLPSNFNPLALYGSCGC
jgi:hypothetical protein